MNVTDPASIAQLTTLDGKTTGVMTYAAISDSATNLVADAGTYVTGSHPVTVTDTGSVAAADLNTIDGLTTGLVTATAAATVTGSVAAVTTALITNAGSSGNKIQTSSSVAVTISDADSTAINATALSAIGLATTGTVTVSNAINITGTINEVTAALITPASLVVAAIANVTITDPATILQLNAIDAQTDGVINAMVTITDTAHNLATLTGTGNNYTLTVSDATPTASDLLKIDAATTQIINATAVTTITGTAADIASVMASQSVGINLSTTVSAAITGSTVSAADLLTIDGVVSGTVVATGVTTLTGSADAVAAVLAAATANPATITLNSTKSNVHVVLDANEVDLSGNPVTVVNAVTLQAINAAGYPVDATAVSHIHGTAADVSALYANGSTIQMANNVAVTLDNDTTTTTELNAIDAHTNATVDATAVTMITGAAVDLAQALGNQAAIDTAANVAITVSAGVAAATDLLAIDNETTGLITATAVTNVTGSIADVKTALVTNYGTSGDKLYTSGAEAVTISGNPVVVTSATVTALDAIDAATTGIITATISGTAADLAGLTGTGNAYTVNVNDVATIAQLSAIDTATTGTLTYAAGITDFVAHLVSGTTASSYITGSVPVTITDPSTIAELTAIDTATSGTLTYGTVHDTAANLATQTSGVWTANPTYIKNGTNIIVDGDITTDELAALDVANGNGTVVSATNTTLSTPNTYLTETISSPSWTVSNGMVAKVIDASGDQVIHIAEGGKLSLTGSDGHNVVVFDAFTASQLTASRSGSTVIFSDKATPAHQIASIAVTSYAPSQTIGFSDGSHVELTLTGSVIALDGTTLA